MIPVKLCILGRFCRLQDSDIYVTEEKRAKKKSNPISRDNVYNDGIGFVENTNISWVMVNEMESRVEDDNIDIEFFLTHKQ